MILIEFIEYLLFKSTEHVSVSDNLIVNNIYMHENTNKVAHHTDAYNFSNLIIRRDQEFIMSIAFNRPFDPNTDLMIIEFLMGEPPLSVYFKCETVSLLFLFSRLKFVSFSNEKDKGDSIIIDYIWVTL